jgi:predicted amidohydrolase YtcJ
VLVKQTFIKVLFCIQVLAGSEWVFAQGSRSADLILYNGRIFTGDAAQPWAQAIAIRDSRVVTVGADAAVRPMAGSQTRMIDLAGRMVMPGINDAHDHVGAVPFGTEAVTERAPMADPTLADLGKALRTAAARAPRGTWVYAAAGPSAMADAGAARAAIEAVSGDHPAMLIAWWGHGIIVNKLGLTALGINENVRDMPGGRYERDATGRLTGKMEEYAGWAALQRLHTGAGRPATVAYLRDYAQRRLAEGVTSVQIMAGYQSPAMFASALKDANMPVRTRVIRFPIPDSRGDGLDAWKAIKPSVAANVRISGVKWVLDGTPQDQLAFSTKEYRGRPGWYGRPNFTTAQLRAKLKAALSSREPLLLHVVGDAMMEAVLTEMEALSPSKNWDS